MFTDENGYITICKFLNINSHEWNIFLNFIKFNHLDNKNNIEVLLYLSNKYCTHKQLQLQTLQK